MTAKRFTLDETFMITDNECVEIINPLMNSKDVAKVYELLNELHEENQDLHKKEVELGQNYLRLLEENERLKKDNELLSDELEQCKAVIDNRWKEYLNKKGDV